MFKRLTRFAFAAAVLALLQAGASAAVKEYPLFSRIDGYKLKSSSKERPFESKKFKTGDKSSDSVTVEGRYFRMSYGLEKGRESVGPAYILGNLTEAVRKAGGKVLHERKHEATMNIQQQGKDIWIRVSTAANGNYYDLDIIERSEMNQEVKLNPVLDAIDKTGRATVYINFDTASARIKPDSASVIEDILAMLRQRPDLKVSIEGHTDSDGNATSNQKLSEDRAAAVAGALVKEGISAARLAFKGFGMRRPVADNKTEEGRAKNRRVELVKVSS